MTGLTTHSPRGRGFVVLAGAAAAAGAATRGTGAEDGAGVATRGGEGVAPGAGATGGAGGATAGAGATGGGVGAATGGGAVRASGTLTCSTKATCFSFGAYCIRSCRSPDSSTTSGSPALTPGSVA